MTNWQELEQPFPQTLNGKLSATFDASNKPAKAVLVAAVLSEIDPVGVSKAQQQFYRLTSPYRLIVNTGTLHDYFVHSLVDTGVVRRDWRGFCLTAEGTRVAQLCQFNIARSVDNGCPVDEMFGASATVVRNIQGETLAPAVTRTRILEILRTWRRPVTRIEDIRTTLERLGIKLDGTNIEKHLLRLDRFNLINLETSLRKGNTRSPKYRISSSVFHPLPLDIRGPHLSHQLLSAIVSAIPINRELTSKEIAERVKDWAPVCVWRGTYWLRKKGVLIRSGFTPGEQLSRVEINDFGLWFLQNWTDPIQQFWQTGQEPAVMTEVLRVFREHQRHYLQSFAQLHLK